VDSGESWLMLLIFRYISINTTSFRIEDVKLGPLSVLGLDPFNTRDFLSRKRHNTDPIRE
jgi:hypothetical protein